MIDTHAKVIAMIPTAYADTIHETIDGTAYSEALKLTACAELTIANKVLTGGTEDCLDVVRVGRLHVHDCILRAGPATRTFVTAKGGGVAHVYEDMTLVGRPRWCSFSFGDWTLHNVNPAMPPMRTVTLRNVARADGRRFLVLQLFCDQIILENTRAIVINLRWLAPFWFWLLRQVRKKDPGTPSQFQNFL